MNFRRTVQQPASTILASPYSSDRNILARAGTPSGGKFATAWRDLRIHAVNASSASKSVRKTFGAVVGAILNLKEKNACKP